MCALAAAAAGCHLDMWNQPRYEALEPSTLWADGMSARPLVEGTVPYKTTRVGDPLYSGLDDAGQFRPGLPMEVTMALLERGQERYDIFCAQCHGRTGQGNGMIVQRGMKVPPSFHEPRLRAMPEGYYFDVITNGFGVMYSYASRIEPRDRWAITAYVRALQLSEDASIADVPEAEREALLHGGEAEGAPHGGDPHGDEAHG
jgi:cytochrome c553